MPVNASSGNSTAGYAVDNDTITTRWESDHHVDPQWIYVDMGSIKTFNMIILVWEAAYATNYYIETSGNSTDWEIKYSTIDFTGGVQTLYFQPSCTAQYVEMYGNYRALNYGYSLYEFGIYNDTAAPAGVNDLTCSNTSRDSELLLNWAAPGDNGSQDPLYNGSYEIQYSSLTAHSALHSVFMSTSCSPGDRQSRLLTDLTNGTSWFARVLTRDHVPNLAADLSPWATGYLPPTAYITKTVSTDTAKPGNVITITITADNIKPVSINNAYIVDSLPLFTRLSGAASGDNSPVIEYWYNGTWNSAPDASATQVRWKWGAIPATTAYKGIYSVVVK